MSTTDELIKRAVAVRQNSYAPYSNYRVGVAVRTASGDISVGTNVENASYPLCVCAERHAVAAAVAQGCKPGQIQEVAVVTQSDQPAAPCGACRQVLYEFCSPDATIHLHSVKTDQTESIPFATLVPRFFGPEDLKR